MSLEAKKMLRSTFGVTDHQLDQLSVYAEILIKWQSKVNLVSPDSLPDIWTRHFIDSAQMKPLIKNGTSVLDIGSGAGFPGMVLALIGNNKMTLVESDGKKVAFLEEVARQTKTTVKVLHARIEHCKPFNVDVVTSRACAKLSVLLEYAFPFISHETLCLFPKGKNYATEIKEAQKKWRFSFKAIPSVTDEHGAILAITQVEKL